MKTVFDKETREKLAARINSVNENETPQWGKMNSYQMLKHCCLSEELYLGNKTYPRVFIGRLFGKMALKSILKEGSPVPQKRQDQPEFSCNRYRECGGNKEEADLADQ
jgi:hypothetical protein